MTIDHTTAREPEEQDNTLGAETSFPYSARRDLACVMALIEATRERRLAAFRISELTRQAVDSLLRLGETAE